MRGLSLRLWLLLRVPALLLVAFLARDRLIAAFMRDETWITLSTIDLLATPATRLILASGFAVAILLAIMTAARFGTALAWLLPVFVAAAFFIIVWQLGSGPTFGLAGFGAWPLGVAVLIAALNLVPDEVRARFLPNPAALTRLVALLPGVAELFGLRYWAAALVGGSKPPAALMSRRRPAGAIVSVLVPAMTAGIIASGAALVPYEQALRAPDDLKILATGDLNWIELDGSRSSLIVAGRGLTGIARFDLARPGEPPAMSPANVGKAQSFAYDPVAGEIYVFNHFTYQLLYLDAATLALKRTLSIDGVAGGDAWIAFDPGTDTLTIISEADDRSGSPFVVLDRASGAILDRRDYDAGNFALNAGRPILYLTYFRRRQSLMAYDLATRQLAREVPTPPRLDRIAMLTGPDEIVIAQPDRARLLRYDPDTLAFRGEIGTLFGGRVAVGDPTRGLILVASIATGEVETIDRASGRSVRRFYLGPWLRSIAVAPQTGMAYVSSNGALYAFRYAQEP